MQKKEVYDVRMDTRGGSKILQLGERAKTMKYNYSITSKTMWLQWKYYQQNVYKVYKSKGTACRQVAPVSFMWLYMMLLDS